MKYNCFKTHFQTALRTILSIDHSALSLLEGRFFSRRLFAFSKIYTHLGDAIVHIPIGIAIVFFGSANSKFLALKWLVATFLGGLVLYPMRVAVKRPRPRGNLPDGYLPMPEFDKFSFPSGHGLRNFLIPFVFFACTSPFFWLLILFAISVSFSRLYLRYHFLSDIVMGALIGVSIGILSIWTGPGVVYR
jgi:undecaprenyl-diphosphatase